VFNQKFNCEIKQFYAIFQVLAEGLFHWILYSLKKTGDFYLSAALKKIIFQKGVHFKNNVG
jgi:hypothetical protein